MNRKRPSKNDTASVVAVDSKSVSDGSPNPINIFIYFQNIEKYFSNNLVKKLIFWQLVKNLSSHIYVRVLGLTSIFLTVKS
jgi:hypothetical protein